MSELWINFLQREAEARGTPGDGGGLGGNEPVTPTSAGKK